MSFCEIKFPHLVNYYLPLQHRSHEVFGIIEETETRRMDGNLATRLARQTDPSGKARYHHLSRPWKQRPWQRTATQNHARRRTHSISSYEDEKQQSTQTCRSFRHHVATGGDKNGIFSLLRKIPPLLHGAHPRITHAAIERSCSTLLRHRE